MVIFNKMAMHSRDEKLRKIEEFCCKKSRDSFWYTEIVTIKMLFGHIKFVHPNYISKLLGLDKNNPKVFEESFFGINNIENIIGYLRGYDRRDNTVVIEPFKKVDREGTGIIYPLSMFLMKVDADSITYIEKLHKIKNNLYDSKAPSVIYEIKFKERQSITLKDIYNNEIANTEPIKSLVGYLVKKEKNGILLNIFDKPESLNMITYIPFGKNILEIHQIDSKKDSIDAIILN